MKKFLLAFLLCLLAQPVLAACPPSLLLQDAAGIQAPAKYLDDGTGLCIVVMDTNTSGNLISAINGAIPTGSNVIGFTSNDPCAQANKTNLPFTTSGTSSVQLVALSGATTIYVCSLSMIVAGATTVAFTTGTGSACVTNNAAVIGTTTGNVSNSMSFAANGGLTLGNGSGTIAKGAAASELCIVLGTNVVVAGNLTYVQQ